MRRCESGISITVIARTSTFVTQVSLDLLSMILTQRSVETTASKDTHAVQYTSAACHRCYVYFFGYRHRSAQAPAPPTLSFKRAALWLPKSCPILGSP